VIRQASCKIFLVGLAAWAVPAFAAAQSTLEYASFLQQIVRQHPVARAAAARSHQSDDARAQAWWELAPTAGIELDVGRRQQVTTDVGGGNIVEVTPKSLQRLNVNAEQVLLDAAVFGGIKASRRAGLADHESAVDDLARAIVVQTELYLDAWTAKRQVDASAAAKARAETTLRAVTARVSVGAAVPTDRLAARLDLLEAERALGTARRRLQRARYVLGRAVAANAPVRPGTAPTPIPEHAPAFPAGRRLAQYVDARPDVRAQQERVEAAKGRIGVGAGTLAPRVNLIGNYNKDFEPGFFGRSENWSVFAQAEWRIEGLAKRGFEVAEAVHARRVAEAELAALRLEAENEILAAWEVLGAAEVNLRAAKTRVRLARRLQSARRQEYELGRIDLLTLRSAESELAQAQRTLVDARARWVLAWLTYWRTNGTLDRELVARWDVELPTFMRP